ncbi:hypothetical protein [Stygiolobus caldivivus]|uniref:Uncharacterized protein n=1 Tax=Stygiolobus caldivivus TaxID=2824673 RepID=A0A8D5ZE93_9CREN|nr:hypothetical protein [Stygiolobus caldivivus]BCU69538.1 hypothetical protein KN1_08350 [Stygiolobus caldivivus]
MSFIVDLDKDTCGNDVIEALGNFSLGVVYKISKDNPYLEEVLKKYKIEVVREEGDVIYFQVISFSG